MVITRTPPATSKLSMNLRQVERINYGHIEPQQSSQSLNEEYLDNLDPLRLEASSEHSDTALEHGSSMKEVVNCVSEDDQGAERRATYIVPPSYGEIVDAVGFKKTSEDMAQAVAVSPTGTVVRAENGTSDADLSKSDNETENSNEDDRKEKDEEEYSDITYGGDVDNSEANDTINTDYNSEVADDSEDADGSEDANDTEDGNSNDKNNPNEEDTDEDTDKEQEERVSDEGEVQEEIGNEAADSFDKQTLKTVRGARMAFPNSNPLALPVSSELGDSEPSEEEENTKSRRETYVITKKPDKKLANMKKAVESIELVGTSKIIKQTIKKQIIKVIQEDVSKIGTTWETIKKNLRHHTPQQLKRNLLEGLDEGKIVRTKKSGGESGLLGRFQIPKTVKAPKKELKVTKSQKLKSPKASTNNSASPVHKLSVKERLREAINALETSKGVQWKDIRKYVLSDVDSTSTAMLTTLFKKAFLIGLEDGWIARSKLTESSKGLQGYFKLNTSKLKKGKRSVSPTKADAKQTVKKEKSKGKNVVSKKIVEQKLSKSPLKSPRLPPKTVTPKTFKMHSESKLTEPSKPSSKTTPKKATKAKVTRQSSKESTKATPRKNTKTKNTKGETTPKKTKAPTKKNPKEKMTPKSTSQTMKKGGQSQTKSEMKSPHVESSRTTHRKSPKSPKIPKTPPNKTSKTSKSRKVPEKQEKRTPKKVSKKEAELPGKNKRKKNVSKSGDETTPKKVVKTTKKGKK